MGICGSKQKVAKYNSDTTETDKYINDIDDGPSGPKSHAVKVGGNGLADSQNPGINDTGQGGNANGESAANANGISSPSKKGKKKGANLSVDNDATPFSPGSGQQNTGTSAQQQSTKSRRKKKDKNGLEKQDSGDINPPQGPESTTHGSQMSQETMPGSTHSVTPPNTTPPGATPRDGENQEVPMSPTANGQPRIPLIRSANRDELRTSAHSGIQAPYIDSEIAMEAPPGQS